MIREAIPKLIEGSDLNFNQMQAVMEEIMLGKASAVQISSFITAMRIKGETIDEITAATSVMRSFASKIPCRDEAVLDTCGTGGDNKGTFNISTIAAFVAAGAGVSVAKHGNRSVSSSCGSADLLEALGVNINRNVKQLCDSLRDIGIAFLFAPNLHPAMKYAQPVRRELGVKTIFNILGPLSNPACARHQLIGVYERGLTEVFARVLKNLGSKHALIVHGADGLDEITTIGPTYVCELKKGKITSYIFDPRNLGIKKPAFKDLVSSSIKSNLRIALMVLKGKKGPQRDIVLLNAAAALYAADKVKSIKDGLKIASESIDSGRAFEKLSQLKEYSLREQ